MKRRLSALVVAILVAALCATALAAEKNGITPLAPKKDAVVTKGRAPTFRMKVDGPGTVWVHVCKSAHKREDGTICSTQSIGQARLVGNEYRFKPKFFNYDSFWLNRPGTYYWQPHRIDCAGGTQDCKQEGPVTRFRVGR
jgi:hypothetical protein